jgi:nucleoside-diphosphate-sugar epimerase
MLPGEWEGEPFALIHLAWDTRRPRAFATHAQHVELLAGILDHWTPRGLETLIVAGSAEEFGQLEGRIPSDATPQGSTSAYGWGKRSAMTLVESWSRMTEKPALWMRPFIVYGPGQSGQMLLPYAIGQALARQDAYFSSGLQERDFVHVDDVAAAFVAAVQRREPGFQGINLGAGMPVRVCDVLDLVGRTLGVRQHFHLGAVKRREGEPLVQFADVSRASSVLGWRARISWHDGVEQLCYASREAMAWTA